jgi:flagellar export protein FliJ
MKGFLFRLERVLHLRTRAERERAQALGHALRDEEARRVAREEAEDRLRRSGDQVAEASEGVTNAGTLRIMGLAVQAAAGQLEAATLSHVAAEDSVRQEQQRFGEARRDRRVLERLREQRKETWDRETARQEQKDHDSAARERRSGGAGR